MLAKTRHRQIPKEKERCILRREISFMKPSKISISLPFEMKVVMRWKQQDEKQWAERILTGDSAYEIRKEITQPFTRYRFSFYTAREFNEDVLRAIKINY